MTNPRLPRRWSFQLRRLPTWRGETPHLLGSGETSRLAEMPDIILSYIPIFPRLW